ncbi:ell-associated factor Eaf [Drosophila hydei]|uniref:Ell-associated factor Eaf n=1 Tax=Drosophila hydei TaxID=7224 RepID=A0A6J1LTV4_DROHY|nr:ell-associated factor Eaf [Drosophila hydei]
MMMTKQKPTLTERLNISGDEVRELKLGATFNPKNTATAFHTIKYDFKPASVDTSRMATVDVGSNNQVTVTVPNLESSGVPQTVYKGNHKKYTKECLIIFDKETGAITLEKLNHNIQVKKTRSEMTNKPSLMPATNAAPIPTGANGVPMPSAPIAGTGSALKLENSTMRITSKTKVSTGSRRNNIIDFKPRNSPMQQSSPSRPVASHRSPQSAPAWHANNAQQTLPSIPMIMDDDDFGLSAALHNGGQANISGSSTGSSVGQPDYGSAHMGKQRQAPNQGHGKRQQQTQRSSPPMHQQQQQNYGRGGGNNNYAQQQQQHQQQHQQQMQQRASFSHSNHSNSMPLDLDSPSHHEQSASMAQAAAALEQQIGGELSASSSSSESESSDSDSGSDSDDSTEDDRPTHQEQQPPGQLSHHHHMQQQQQQHQHHHQQQQQQHMHQLPNLGLGSISPTYNSHHHHQQQQQQQQQQQSHHHHHQQQSGIYASNGGFPNDLLQNDLQLSSNSSDDDD